MTTIGIRTRWEAWRYWIRVRIWPSSTADANPQYPAVLGHQQAQWWLQRRVFPSSNFICYLKILNAFSHIFQNNWRDAVRRVRVRVNKLYFKSDNVNKQLECSSAYLVVATKNGQDLVCRQEENWSGYNLQRGKYMFRYNLHTSHVYSNCRERLPALRGHNI